MMLTSLPKKKMVRRNISLKVSSCKQNKRIRNGRVYPRETLMKEAKSYDTEYVQKNRAMGELGHPQGPTVNLDRVSP